MGATPTGAEKVAPFYARLSWDATGRYRTTYRVKSQKNPPARTLSDTGGRYVGRRGGIRTRDPLHPMQVRYQAALHAEAFNYMTILQEY